MNADPAPALTDIRRARRRAYDALSRFNSLTGLPKGATFALRADASVVLPLTRWLYEYLGMVPAAVFLDETTADQASALRRHLREIDGEEAWESDVADNFPDLVFGGEDFIGRYRIQGPPVKGIDIAMPGSGAIDIVPKCYMGPTGALWLLEWILNTMSDFTREKV